MNEPEQWDVFISHACEDKADEFWSDGGEKSNQRWTWYALDRANGTLLAHQNGRRPDEMGEQRLAKLAAFPIATYYTKSLTKLCHIHAF